MNYQTLLKSLDKLLGSIEDDIVSDEQRVKNLRSAWTAGREAYNYKREHGVTTKHIARDLDIPNGTLDKFVRIYRLYPEGLRDQIDGHPLNLSHYTAIMYIRAEEAREFYLKEAALNDWSSSDLRKRVRNHYYENRQAVAPAKDGGKSRPVLKDKGQKLYTYGARVLKVVDGDTLFLSIDVGFKTSMEHKVRLRGINCPEAGTELGDKATAFVRKRLLETGGDEGSVVIRSYKMGKFGRYIVDVWYMPQETDAERILREGHFLNQELLDEGLAVLME